MEKNCFIFTTLMLSLVFVFNGCNPGGSETDSPENPTINPQGNFVWVCKGGGSLYDTGCAIAVDSNNNLYTAGFFEGSAVFGNTSLIAYGNESYDIFIAKYDSAGNLIWVKQAGSDDYDEGLSITTDNLDNFYVTGYFKGTAAFGGASLTSSGERDIFIGKYDSSGNLIWVKQAGGSGDDEGSSITTDNANNVLVTGSFVDITAFENNAMTSNGSSDIFIAKYDSSGNLLWVKQAGGPSFDRGYSVTTDNSDNFYVTGYFKGTAAFGDTSITTYGDRDVFIAKYDSSGNLLWIKQGGGSYWDYGYSLTTDYLNNVYITGSFFESAVFDGTSLTSAGHNDIFIAKYDSSGNLIWVKQAGGTSYDRGKSIIADNSGNIYLTGHFKTNTTFENTFFSAYGQYDIFIARYDSNGNLIWVKQAGGDDYDEGCSITRGNDNSIYVTGAYSCYYQAARFDDISLTSEYFDFFVGKIVEK